MRNEGGGRKKVGRRRDKEGDREDEGAVRGRKEELRKGGRKKGKRRK